MKVKILITGFEPFFVRPKNPSWTAAQRAVQKNKEAGEPYDMVCYQIPVLWHGANGKDGAWEAIQAAVRQEKPDCLICMGESAGIKEIHFETIAINKAGDVKDNADQQFECSQTGEVEIEKSGNASKRTTLPEQVISEYNRLYPNHTPVQTSDNAGRYLCNFVFYKSLTGYSDTQIPHRGFIHIGSEEQADDVSLLIQLIAKVVQEK